MIRMNDFAAEPAELHAAQLAAVERVFKSGRFILGREVEQFENAWAEFCGAKFCVGVGNGMEAIELGLRSLGIGAGDEVITTSMTAIATIFAIMQAGATPVLADIDPATALLDLKSVERCITAKTKAVLLVHLYGRLNAMDHWKNFCEHASLHLLEDCAQAHGAKWDKAHAGTFGTWGAFSFYPTKNLGARGDGGALITSSREIADRVRSLRNLGTSKRYEHVEAGYNSRLDEMQAAILSARLSWLEKFNARRREIAQKYFAGCKNARIELLARPQDSASHVYHLFVVRTRERERLQKFLAENKIESLIHYPIPAHRQKSCPDIRCDPRTLANCEAHAAQCLSLPCHPQMTDDDVEKVIAALNAF